MKANEKSTGPTYVRTTELIKLIPYPCPEKCCRFQARERHALSLLEGGNRKKAGLPLRGRFGFCVSIAFCCLLFSVLTLQARELTGQVVGVQDGDTLSIRQESGFAVKIRLWGIDAPEKVQAYSNASKRHLSSLAFGKKVRLIVRDTDRYGRTVAEIILPDGCNVNQEMVRAGYAWWFRKYAPNDKVLADLETEARKAKRGLWADPNVVPPWEFRRIKQKR